MVLLAAKLALAASLVSYVAASPVEKGVLTIPVEKRTKSAQVLAKDIVSNDLARIGHYHEKAAAARGETYVHERASSGTVTNEDVS